MGTPRKKVNLGAQVEEVLRKRILDLEYPHNHVLVEEALCAEFGVSRSPVREALRMLEAADLTHKTSSRSYIVKQISQRGVKELYELRLALERYVVEGLCSLHNTAPLEALLVHWQTVSMEAVPDRAAADREFHETLAELYGNSVILEALRQINDRLRVFRVMDFARENRLCSTQDQHVALLTAIIQKDGPKALECLETNVNEGMKNAVETLRQAILRAHERE